LFFEGHKLVMMNLAVTQPDASASENEAQLTQARLQRLLDDLAFALKRTQTSTLRAWVCVLPAGW